MTTSCRARIAQRQGGRVFDAVVRGSPSGLSRISLAASVIYGSSSFGLLGRLPGMHLARSKTGCYVRRCPGGTAWQHERPAHTSGSGESRDDVLRTEPQASRGKLHLGGGRFFLSPLSLRLFAASAAECQDRPGTTEIASSEWARYGPPQGVSLFCCAPTL